MAQLVQYGTFPLQTLLQPGSGDRGRGSQLATRGRIVVSPRDAHEARQPPLTHYPLEGGHRIELGLDQPAFSPLSLGGAPLSHGPLSHSLRALRPDVVVGDEVDAHLQR